jgi:hypothetical protein
MSEGLPHPRARALRITFALLAGWFLVLAAVLGVLSQRASTSVLGIAMFAVGFSMGALLSGRQGLAPSGTTLSRRRQITIVTAIGISSVNAIAAIVWLASSHGFGLAEGAAFTVVGLVCGGASLAQLLAR